MISSMILDGKSNKDIISELAIDRTNQITDLFARIRKKYSIPDFNSTGVSKDIQSEIVELIKLGKSNKYILEKYNIERNTYSINMLGRLRQSVKKKSSTTIESPDNDKYRYDIIIEFRDFR